MNKKQSIRTRFAPSPTGYLHVGNLRTALYAFLFARKNKGQFILRIEDTDQKRFVQDAVLKLLETLHTFKLDYDEGLFFEKGSLIEKGDYQPYIQSARLEIYQQYAKELVEKGFAYYSFKTEDELAAIRTELSKKNIALKRSHLNENYTPNELSTKITQGVPYVIRLETPLNGKIVLDDLIKGRVELDLASTDDTILLKSDGFPTYHLASVIDDCLMKITHVIRGEEWLPSASKHIYLYQCLGIEPPRFAHLPLILNPDKSKLSKRQGDVAAEDYLSKGYLPEALLNFIALVGWNPGEGSTEEIFSLKQLIKEFDLAHVNKAGAVFDIKKLNWMNAKYLREILSLDEYLELPMVQEKLLSFLNSSAIGQSVLNNKTQLELLAKISRERIEFLAQLDEFVAEQSWLGDQLPAVGREMIAWRKSTVEDAAVKLTELAEFIGNLKENEFTVEKLEVKIKDFISKKGYGVGDVLWPMRVALTGREKSPNPFEVATLLGKNETLRRLEQAILSCR